MKRVSVRLLGINRAGYTLPQSDWFPLFLNVLRRFLDDPNWEPKARVILGSSIPDRLKEAPEPLRLGRKLPPLPAKRLFWIPRVLICLKAL